MAGLAGCTGFDACVFARRWDQALEFLDEVSAAGAEACSLCASTLSRLARDHAADVAGARGRFLPLLSVGPGAELPGAAAQGRVDIVLVQEEPRPIVVGSDTGDPANFALGSIHLCPGVRAWLSLCRPLAIWSTADHTQRGDKHRTQEHKSSNGAVQSPTLQVVSALQAAVAVQLTEQLVTEVWEALDEHGLLEKLQERSCGAWVCSDNHSGGLIL